MRTMHIPHIHKPDWHHLREQFSHVFHDPLFWAILVLAVIFIAMLFLATLGPAAPQTPEPYVPVYPYAY